MYIQLTLANHEEVVDSLERTHLSCLQEYSTGLGSKRQLDGFPSDETAYDP